MKHSIDSVAQLRKIIHGAKIANDYFRARSAQRRSFVGVSSEDTHRGTGLE
jgi:hypothetical protein